ncbi:hypothetical protein BS50DRAFT_580847 [Corynespora cassiicola Philippines]|uniref:Uncharacterized protein n=1 Tax=Corynespora cassiicola Philippines TaxID=1448308 RepID=A0A2T2P8L4_CORCC|nr:hypothetical protein BS50DRAFT_580847 [Corynespora cassiicola Philippines]
MVLKFLHLTLFTLLPLSSALVPHATLSLFPPKCTACAPVDLLRSSAFGIELSPDFLTLSMKFPNATVAPLMSMKPSDRFWALMVNWMEDAMRQPEDTECNNPQQGLGELIRREKEITIVEEEVLRLVRDELQTYYPEIVLEYGAIAIPNFIYRRETSNSIVETAVRRSGLLHEGNDDNFQICPTDFALTATTAYENWKSALLEGSELKIKDSHFDALVITSTSSYLSASWYQWGFVQGLMGHVIEPRNDPSVPANLSRITQFLEEIETMYDSKAVAYRRSFIKDKPRLIFRFDDALDAYILDDYKIAGNISGSISWSVQKRRYRQIHIRNDGPVEKLAEALQPALKRTRFDPYNPDTAVYRDEEEKAGPWKPSFYTALITKTHIDSALPKGCHDEHVACKELRECVKQEARGELVICEDATPPNTTFTELLEQNVEAGNWRFFDDAVFPWIKTLSDELEARLWLLACPPSNEPSPRCKKAIVEVSDELRGVWDDQLFFADGIISGVAEYWLRGRLITSLLIIPIQYFSVDNLVLMLFWGMHKVLGRELYDRSADTMTSAWEMEVKPFLEEESEEERERLANIK